jgi:cytochrome c556
MTLPNVSASRRLAFAALLSILAGCATAPAIETTQQPVATSQTFKPEISVNQVMVSVIDHNSHFLWDVADAAKAPKNDRDWHELEHAAVTLVGSGSMLMMGGTGPSDNDWSKQPEWAKLTQDQTDAANAAVKAVSGKDMNALLAAGDKIVAACENCHTKYKPELPKVKAQHH